MEQIDPHGINKDKVQSIYDGNYPRPQLGRAHWISLDGPWRFRFDNELKFRMPQDVPEWPLVINVLFAPESKRSGIGDTSVLVVRDRLWRNNGFHANCD